MRSLTKDNEKILFELANNLNISYYNNIKCSNGDGNYEYIEYKREYYSIIIDIINTLSLEYRFNFNLETNNLCDVNYIVETLHNICKKLNV